MPRRRPRTPAFALQTQGGNVAKAKNRNKRRSRPAAAGRNAGPRRRTHGPAAQGRAPRSPARATMRRLAVPALLFAACFGAYVGNGDFLPRQRPGRQHAVQREPAQAPRSVDQSAARTRLLFLDPRATGRPAARPRRHQRMEQRGRYRVPRGSTESPLTLLLSVRHHAPRRVRQYLRPRGHADRDTGLCGARPCSSTSRRIATGGGTAAP